MSAPAFYTELRAFSLMTGAEMEDWEVRALRAIYGVYVKTAGKARGSAAKNEVSANDGAGVAGLMKGLGAKKG